MGKANRPALSRRTKPAPPSVRARSKDASAKRHDRYARVLTGQITRKPLERERPVVDRGEVRQARAAVHRKIKTP